MVCKHYLVLDADNQGKRRNALHPRLTWMGDQDVPNNAPDLLVPFDASAGNIVVIDGHLYHTSGSNVTKDEDRTILFVYYSAPHMRPLTNWSAKLPRELQDTLSPQMKEVLALGHVGYVVRGDLTYMAEKYKYPEKGADPATLDEAS